MTWPPHHLIPQQTLRHQNTWLQSARHHHRGTAESLCTAKEWFGHGAGRSPCAHSIGKFFLCYIYFFLLKLPPPACPGTTCIYYKTPNTLRFFWEGATRTTEEKIIIDYLPWQCQTLLYNIRQMLFICCGLSDCYAAIFLSAITLGSQFETEKASFQPWGFAEKKCGRDSTGCGRGSHTWGRAWVSLAAPVVLSTIAQTCLNLASRETMFLRIQVPI